MTSYGKLTRRSQFTAARKGRRVETAAFTIQAIRPAADAVSGASSPVPQPAPARFGLTVTKKIGNAVVRNRIKRRLRGLIQVLPDTAAAAGCDHVLFARREALTRDFAAMVSETEAALAAVASRLRAPRSIHRPAPPASASSDSPPSPAMHRPGTAASPSHAKTLLKT
ncbi:MAG: ribonuclease P protein component [Beijerinckiaceae bacterium]